MFRLLWLVAAIPFASAAVLALFGSRLSRRMVAILGAGSVGLAAPLTLLIGIEFLIAPPAGHAYVQPVWTWVSLGGFQPELAFYLDPVSLLMLLVVTFVSFLIHLYSVEYMRDDEGYARFFAYMNLFVASMITLVLANNLLFLYLGWEGVGLCSFLLIGFWYQDPANVRAASKAFIVTRVGDTAFAVGLFLLFTRLGTLDIQELMHRASVQWTPGSGIAVTAAALLLGGAVGKSAQLPLQTWLPDAMAGPTPTSALIHAATMVTAGVYLIARTHLLFTLAPPVQFAVAIIGAATMLLAAFSALAQRDMKRVLAYSTISQIGYMFLALGLGAWSAALFHFMTHAFFKALRVLSLTGGYVDTPPHFGGVPALSDSLSSALPPLEEVHIGPITETITALCASAAFGLGLALAYLLYGPQRSRVPAQGFLPKLWLSGWDFDWAYDRLFVRPFQWLVRKGRGAVLDLPIHGLRHVTRPGLPTLPPPHTP